MKHLFTDFLTDEGIEIYTEIMKHLDANNLSLEIDYLELAMLANSFDLYAKAAKKCNLLGYSTKATASGYTTINPDYLVLKTEYGNLLKHSGKFGLSAGDRMRIFKGLLSKKAKKVDPSDDLD